MEQRTSLISAVPAELLLLIFQEVYLDLPIPHAHTALRHLLDPTSFPYSLANVCRVWKGLVFSVPRYATRLLVYIDASIALSELEILFSASRNFSFDLYVTRKHKTSIHRDPLEKRRVANILQALTPHIHRCRVVHFELLHHVSLPTVPRIFRGTNLQFVRISSQLMDLQWRPQTVPNPLKASTEFRFSPLVGCTFLEAMSFSDWRKAFLKLALRFRELSISRLKPSADHDLNLPSFLHHIGRLDYLKNLSLEAIELPYVVTEPVNIAVKHLTLKSMSWDTVRGLFMSFHNNVYLASLTLEKCELGGGAYPRSWVLTLRDIDSAEAVLSFLSGWDGFDLRLENCKGIDDRLLELFAQFNPRDQMFVAPTLRKLTVHPSRSITPGAIKELVIARQDEADRHDHTSQIPHSLPMYAVTVSGQGLQISAEDKAWLSEAMECFKWDTIIPPSPVLKNDCCLWPAPLLDALCGITPTIPGPVIEEHGSQELPADSETLTPVTPISRFASPFIEGDYCQLPPSVLDALMMDTPPSSQRPRSESPIIEFDYCDLPLQDIPDF